MLSTPVGGGTKISSKFLIANAQDRKKVSYQPCKCTVHLTAAYLLSVPCIASGMRRKNREDTTVMTSLPASFCQQLPSHGSYFNEGSWKVFATSVAMLVLSAGLSSANERLPSVLSASGKTLDGTRIGCL